MRRPRGEGQQNPAETQEPPQGTEAATGPEAQQQTTPAQPVVREAQAATQRSGTETQVTPSPSEPTSQERRRQGSNRDRSPFWRNRVNTETREETVPEEPSVNLERERNYSQNEEINHLIQRIRTGEWQKHEESQRLEQRYGRAGALRQMKEWLGGERDFTYDEETGTMQYHRRTEVARRVAHIGINTAETAGIMLAAGALTGGVGAAFGGALLGSTLGRGFAQAWRGISGVERGMREDLEISRVRYYQKARELADRIGPEEPTEGLTPEKESNYDAERNTAIKDLVNFVNSSEQHGVAIRLTGEENDERDTEERQGLRSRITNFFRSSGGRPYIRGGAQGEPLEPQVGPGEPMGGGQSGHSMVTGTEVYQPSEVAPTRQTLDDMEKNFEQYRTRWEWIETGLALVGGAAGGARAILEAKKGIAQATADKLARGEIVRLDVDGNGIAHGVQRVTDGIKSAWNVASEYIFHYNSAAEAMADSAANAQILPIGQFGSHLLEGAKTVAGAINKEALQQAAQGAIGIFSGLFAHAAWRGATNERQHERHGREREEMKQEQEILRRRLQPEPIVEAHVDIAQLKNEFHENNKPFPEQGQNWMWDGKRILIESVDDSDPNKVMLSIIRENLDEDYDEVMVIPAESLLSDDSVCIRNREGGRRERREQPLDVNLDKDEDEGEGEAEPEPGTQPPSGPAPTAEDLRGAESGVPEGSHDSGGTVIINGHPVEVTPIVKGAGGGEAPEAEKGKSPELNFDGIFDKEATWKPRPDKDYFTANMIRSDGKMKVGERININGDEIFHIEEVIESPRKGTWLVRFSREGESDITYEMNIGTFVKYTNPDIGVKIDNEQVDEADRRLDEYVEDYIKELEGKESGSATGPEGKADKDADLAERRRAEGRGEEEGEDEEDKDETKGQKIGEFDIAQRRKDEIDKELEDENSKQAMELSPEEIESKFTKGSIWVGKNNNPFQVSYENKDGSQGKMDYWIPQGGQNYRIVNVENPEDYQNATVDFAASDENSNRASLIFRAKLGDFLSSMVPNGDNGKPVVENRGAETKGEEVAKGGSVREEDNGEIVEGDLSNLDKIDMSTIKPGDEVVSDRHIPRNITFIDKDGIDQNLEQYVREHRGLKYFYNSSEHGEIVVKAEGNEIDDEMRILEDDFIKNFLTERREGYSKNYYLTEDEDEKKSEASKDKEVGIDNWAFMNESGERVMIQPDQTWEWQIREGKKKKPVDFKVKKLTEDETTGEISITFDGKEPVARTPDLWRQIFESAVLTS